MDWLKSAARRARKFGRLKAHERLLAVRIVSLLVLVRVALWTLPFRRVQSFVAQAGKQRSHGTKLSPSQLTSLVSVGADYVPGASCLTQALVAQVVLSRYGYQPILKIGVAHDADSGFEAHAWIECDDQVIIGRVGKFERYTPLPSLHAAAVK